MRALSNALTHPVVLCLALGWLVGSMIARGEVWALALTLPLGVLLVLSGFMLARINPENPLAQTLATAFVWLLWKAPGLRRVDNTAFYEMIGHTHYQADIIELHVARNGVLIVTQAMIPVDAPAPWEERV